MQSLLEMGTPVGELLKARGEKIAISESSSGGLISAALLAVAGASNYYKGGGVVYTARAMHTILQIDLKSHKGRPQKLSAAVFPPLGALPKPVRPDRTAMATATPPAIPALPSPAR
jgi:hypothetical protein